MTQYGKVCRAVMFYKYAIQSYFRKESPIKPFASGDIFIYFSYTFRQRNECIRKGSPYGILYIQIYGPERKKVIKQNSFSIVVNNLTE